MAEYVKIELVGTVYSLPELRFGTTKAGNDYELGTVTIKAAGQFFNCSAFGGIAQFIGALQTGDTVFVTGFLKSSKGKDDKWYTQLQIDFIAKLGNEIPATHFVKKKTKKQDGTMHEEETRETEVKEEVSPYSFDDSNLPF